MKFQLLLIYTALSLNCSATGVDALADSPSGAQKTTVKRDRNPKKSKSKLPNSKRKKLESSEKVEELDEAKLNELLEIRAELLIAEISKVDEALLIIDQGLQEELKTAKALAGKNNNYEHVSEIAGLVTYAKQLNKSANLILSKLSPVLKSKAKNIVGRASVAIIASGFLANRINQFIEVIEESFKGVHCQDLKNTSDKINEITADISIKNELVSLEEHS